MRHEQQFGGSLSPPSWPEARGLSASDLRWRTERDAVLLNSGTEIAADGLLGRISLGRGVAILCQINPDALDADRITYFRYNRWRSTRAIAQILANLGGEFLLDR